MEKQSVYLFTDCNTINRRQVSDNVSVVLEYATNATIESSQDDTYHVIHTYIIHAVAYAFMQLCDTKAHSKNGFLSFVCFVSPKFIRNALIIKNRLIHSIYHDSIMSMYDTQKYSNATIFQKAVTVAANKPNTALRPLIHQ